MEIDFEDIDIEEHNILEDPALKEIFPDITALKQELEYENEALSVNINGELSLTNSISNYNVDTVLSGQEDDLNKNKITLAGKPIKRCSSHDIINGDVKLKRRAVISLSDIKYSLKKASNFCKYCLVLFPSNKSFEIHTKRVHQKTMNNDEKAKNRTGILESNQIVNKRIIEIKPTSQVLCFHCKSKFPSKIALIDHLYEVLEPKFYKQPNRQQITISQYTSCDILAKSQSERIETELNKTITYNEKEEDTSTRKRGKELFYKCHVCSYYFKCEKFFNEHMFKHNINDYTVNKVIFSPKCKFCSLLSNDIKSYNRHLYNIHRDVLKNKAAQKNKKQTRQHSHLREKRNGANIIERGEAKYFECHLCFYYYKVEALYKQHMLHKHQIQNPSMQKVLFSAKCRFCSIRYNNIKLYNGHIYKTHMRSIIQQVNNLKRNFNRNSNVSRRRSSNNHTKYNILLPKSTLFKCCKCDIVFTSPSLAINHTEHMEMLINWKCGKCNLYFKENDSVNHLLQHSYSEKFTVLKISTDLLSKILYSCPKCAIHYQENKFFDHYSLCENETPQSAHCSVCDILIDHGIKSSHQNGHLKGNMKDTDFITIELVDDENTIRKPQKYTSKKKLIIKANGHKTGVNTQSRHFYFCNTCKCFISKIHKVHIHKASQCSQITKFACNFCGLTLTRKALVSHRKIHQKNKSLKLHDLRFYDLNNGEEICPPIPELPKCESCNIHSVDKNDSRNHMCSVADAKICPFCNINLTTGAYKVHVPFYNYKIIDKPFNTIDDIDISPGAKIENNMEHSDIPKETTLDIVEKNIPVAYCCKVCFVILNIYDEVIKHCQMHLVSTIHPATHKSNANADCIYYFDPFYYGAKNDIWLKHVYGSKSNEKVNVLIKKSIYKYESRVKMEIIQEGVPEFTEYKCGKCNCLVDCLSIFEHIDSCAKNVKKSVCKMCTLSLLTKDLMDKHLATHTVLNDTEKSLRIVVFNKREHKRINNLIKLNACRPYVVYKCRNCAGLINKTDILLHECNPNNLKVCSDCGLSLYSKDYETHIMKHRQLASFNENNIKVVLVGKKSIEQNESNITKNSFIGVVCDYTFYKCSKCEVCIKDFRCTSKHFCLVHSAKAKCFKCDLYFDEGKLKFHLKLHLNDPDFVKDNILTISFDPSDNDVVKKHIPKLVKRKSDAVSVDETHINKEKRVVKFYKCVKCQLHFLTEDDANQHIKKPPGRIKRQNCTKCGFTFSSDALFNHILEHHGKKNIDYNFEVINVTGTFRKQKILKCTKCSLHFTNSKKMYDHYLKCLGDSTKGDRCKFCGVSFTFHICYVTKRCMRIIICTLTLRLRQQIKTDEPR